MDTEEPDRAGFGANSRSSFVPLVPTYPIEKTQFRAISSSTVKFHVWPYGVRKPGSTAKVLRAIPGAIFGKPFSSVSTWLGVVLRVEASANGGWLARLGVSRW